MTATMGYQTLTLTGLRFEASLGILESEKLAPQPIQVDAELSLGTQPLMPRNDEINHVLDYRKVQHNSLGKPYWSTKALIEMNCNNRQVRTRSLAFYSGPKLTGEQLSREGVFDQWRAPPATVNHCGRLFT